MLPFGHLAAGYLAAEAFLHVLRPLVSAEQRDRLVGIGVAASFAPDLDMFFLFWKERAFRHSGRKGNHRASVLHAPLLWLVFSLSIAAAAPDAFWRYAAAMVWIGSWSHFLLDSGVSGVRWLFPFSERYFALKDPGVTRPNDVRGFFRHWLNLVAQGRRHAPAVFYAEIALVVLALGFFLASAMMKP